MIPLFGVIVPLMQALWGRLRDLRDDDRGMTTEAVIITAARSLPATATLRLAGDRAFSRSPRVCAFKCAGDTV